MQGPFLAKRSARLRLAVGFSVIAILGLLLVTTLPPTSTATQGGTQPDLKRKNSRPEFVPGEILVRYKSERIAQQQTQVTLLSAEGKPLSIRVERFAQGADIVRGLRLARVNPEDTLVAIAALKGQPDVLYAEPNYKLYLTDTIPNDPCFPINSLPGCGSLSLYGMSKIGAPKAWDTTTGSSGIVVGVIDEGIDRIHPDLQANIWVNPGETRSRGRHRQ